MTDVTEEVRIKWDVHRDATVQILEVVARVRQLPPGARVREIVVVVDLPVPSLHHGGSHGGT